MDEAELAALRAHRFPGGTATIARWENWLLCDALQVDPPPGDLAHPAFLFHLPLRGVGLDIGSILALGRPDSEDAVRAGGYRWTLHQLLRVETPYAFSGGIVGAERKRGRRAGLMDVLTFRIDVHDDGAPVATAETICLFLRSG
jgi:hypothetical protein